MTLREPMFLENIGAVYNARDYRALFKRLFEDRPGIFAAADLAVTQQAVPAMGVTVAAGGGLVDATGPGIDGLYFVDNDAPVNVAIAAADAVNPRRDIIGVRVRDSESAGGLNDGAIVAITGVPAAVPVDPALPANFLVLARVAVAALAANIVNANITDLRRTTTDQGSLVTAPGGVHYCTSTTRPATGLYAGFPIFETDTLRQYHWTGAAWRYSHGGDDPTAARGYATVPTAISAAARTKVTLGAESYDYGNNFSTVNSQYTCPRAGILEVQARMSCTATTDGQRIIIEVFKNGASASRGFDSHVGAGPSNHGGGVADAFPVAAGDLIDLRAQLVGGVAHNSEVGEDLGYLSCRMRP